MLLQRPTLAVLCNHMCHKGVRATSHLCRPTIDTVLDRLFRTHQPSKPQARRKRFRETPNTKYLLTIRQSIKAGRRCTLKRKIAIDIILYNQQTIMLSYPDDLKTPSFRQRATCRVVKGRNGIQHTGKCTARMQPY